MPEFEIENITDIDKAFRWADPLIAKALKAGKVIMELRREIRSDEQNDKAWPMYRDFSRHAVLGGKKWKDEDWKSFLMSAFNNELPAVGLLGEPVMLGLSTKRLSKKRFSEFIEFIYAAGAEYKVVWSEPSLAFYEEMQC